MGRTLEAGHNRDMVYQRIHALVDKSQSACFLFFPVDYHAVTARIQGTNYFFNRHMPVYQLKNWFITPERRESHGNH
jgi:hypothetical protein